MYFEFLFISRKKILCCIIKRENRKFQSVTNLNAPLNDINFNRLTIFNPLAYMKKLRDPIDSNFLVRLLNLHYFVHIIRTFSLENATEGFSKPRFPLFRQLKKVFDSKEKNSLFKNLLFTFQHEIIIGGIVTIIGASLNLLIPQLIRSFVEFMNAKNLSPEEIGQADEFLYRFILIQTLRLFFAQHSKRLFYELAIGVESTLARKLVSKSLRIARQCRDRIPQSEIIHLENVDLKLIFTLFRNMYLVFEVPFTIIVAIIMLFVQSKRYGFIAVYWFVIAFLLQRQLDGRMTHCNSTKLGLIEQRSNTNYQLLQKMKQAKIVGYQNLIVQKNNDLFIEQNHDHMLFYRYATLYDITLLMLPILVVVTITLYDMNEEFPITVEQVYSLLTLLGICYMPMKSTRTISISMHDGLHSLKRLSQYFHLPQETKSQLIDTDFQPGEVVIKNGTRAAYPHSNYSFQIRCKFHVEIHKGQRLNVISRKSHGCSSFLQMLVGGLKKMKGTVFIGGKIAYKPQKVFFSKQTVQQNIKFYNKKVDSQQVRNIYKLLGLDKDLKYTDGLNMIIDDVNKFTLATLEKIALARTLISDADVFILDSPYSKVDSMTAIIVEEILREKQQQGKTIITALKFLQFIEPHDKIIIINQGISDEYGHFEQLTKNPHSKISKYFKSKQDESAFSQTKSQQIVDRFMNKVRKIVKERSSKESSQSGANNDKRESVLKLFMPAPLLQNTLTLARKIKTQQQAETNFVKYIGKFFTAVSFFQTIYIPIVIIILSAELLHIFIHFYIGHSLQAHMDEGYHNYQNMLILEVVLTFCLSGIIYLEGEVSSCIAVIIGNKLYEESLTELTQKRIGWFTNQYSVKIADRFNHDYQQIFIAVHGLLGIYKNIIIFVATIEFLTINRQNILTIMMFLIVVYLVVFKVIRSVEKKVVKYYYDYKYSYVRLLEESVRGAGMYKIFGIKNEVMKRTEDKYERLASYKLAESYTTYAISILTDVISIVLLGSAIYYGLQMKEDQTENRNIAIIATSVTLLVNLSQVLKTIIIESLKFGTFFSINIMPFLQILDFDTEYKKSAEKTNKSVDQNIRFSKTEIKSFDITFSNIILKEPSVITTQNHPLTFTIKQGQRVLIYETDDQSRNLLLYSLTRNLPMLTEPQLFTDKNEFIRIGSEDIREIQPFKLRSMIGVILSNNFYFSGSVRENINIDGKFDQKEAIEFIKLLGLNMDLQDFAEQGLQTRLNFQANQLNPSITKKIALLRILLRKPKIILLKDTTSFVQSISITEMIDTHYPFKPTIIKINNSIESSFDIDRIIHMEYLSIKEQGLRKQLIENEKSQLGQMLKDINLEGYLYTNRTQTLSKKKKNSIFADLIPFKGKK